MKQFGKFLNRSGASLIETMIAFSIFGIMVVTLYPIFADIQKIGRNTNIRRLCQETVNSKLESYKSGIPVTLNTYMTAAAGWGKAADPKQLKALSLESYSQGAVGSWDGAGDRVLSGFAYAKVRYNHFFPESCIGESFAELTRNAPFVSSVVPQMQYLGIRECISSMNPGDPPPAWVDDASKPDANRAALCTSFTDKKVLYELPGFKLYVKLELETPWKYGAPETSWSGGKGYPSTADLVNVSNSTDSLPSVAKRLHDHCPNFGNTNAGTSSYDFSGQSDAIKITVTGVVDFPNMNLQNVGGMTNWNELTCQSSAVITPYRYPARYMLTQQNKIYSIHGTAWNNSTEIDSTGNDATGNIMSFKNIYYTATSNQDPNGLSQASASTGATSSNPSNAIVSFSVHPRDAAIWVLRSGTLTRYSNCFDTPTNCIVGDDTANAKDGFPDVYNWDPSSPVGMSAAWPSVQSWNVPTGITSLGVDYRTGRVFGFAKSQSGGVILELKMANGDPLGKCQTPSTQAIPSGCTPGAGGAAAPGGATLNDFREEVASRGIDCIQGGVPVPCPVTIPPATSPILPAGMRAEYPRPYFVNLPTRVNGFFMSPSGDAVYVTDNTSSIVFGDEVYNASVYRVTDEFLSVPIMTLPFFVTTFSM